jgi:hypothetical protein
MDVRDLSLFLLYRPMGRLSIGFLRNCLMGLLFGVILLAGNALCEVVSWNTAGGMFAVGFTLSFFLWGSFRLWSFTVAPMLEERGKILHVLTRLPYWVMAGGIGYTMGLLIVKKIHLAVVQDIPVKHLFFYGGKFGAGIELLFECAGLLILRQGKKS